MTPPSLFTDLTVISCPNCNANYAASQSICPRCRGMGGKKHECADGAKKGVNGGNDVEGNGSNPPLFEATEGPERDLEEEVEAWLDEQHYYFFHDRSKKANSPGFLDLVIALPRAVTAWLELKKKNEYPTKEQKETIQHLSALGHHVKVARSLEEVKAWIEGLLGREE